MDAMLHEVSREVVSQLCSLGSERSFMDREHLPSLVFPLKRSDSRGGGATIRVSEAEARLLFSLELSKCTIPFAVEAPTFQQYSFKGTTPMSARTDLLVYTRAPDTPGGLHRHVGIKFKAHNAQTESIRKDLEKLLREGHDGLWFHILQNIDSRTLVSFFGKLRSALEGMAEG
jgi:hypothetical protein